MTMKGQVSIEFALAFAVCMVFLTLVTQLFSTFCSQIVNNHAQFEQTRSSTSAEQIITTPGGADDLARTSDNGFTFPPPAIFDSTTGNTN